MVALEAQSTSTSFPLPLNTNIILFLPRLTVLVADCRPTAIPQVNPRHFDSPPTPSLQPLRRYAIQLQRAVESPQRHYLIYAYNLKPPASRSLPTNTFSWLAAQQTALYLDAASSLKVTQPFSLQSHAYIKISHITFIMRDQRSGTRPPRHGPGMDHYIRKPSLPRPAVPLPPPLIIKPSFEWQKWDELVIRVRGLLPTETTFTVWKNFRAQGNISFIELYENRNGQREGFAKIKFSPTPHEPFWTQSRPPGTYTMRPDNGTCYNIHVSLSDDRRQGLRIQSPIRRQVFYDPKMKLFASTLHFGLMTDPRSMMPLNSVYPIEDELAFVVDLLRNRIVANFEVQFRDPRLSGASDYVSPSKKGSYNRINKYMFQIPFGQLKRIQRMDLNPQVFALVITLDSPPQYYRKRQDDTAGHAEGNLLWSEFDTWYRQTDIVYDPYRLQTAKVTLHKERPVIDIGMDSRSYKQRLLTAQVAGQHISLNSNSQ